MGRADGAMRRTPGWCTGRVQKGVEKKGSSMDALQAIERRRSVRDYTGDPIPRADLEAILDAARLAPTGYNRQPWEFVVVTEQETIDALAVAADWMRKAAAIMAVVLDDSARFWLEDGAAAVTNMLIAATALGYGSCWLQGSTLPHEEEFKALLGVPEDRRLLTLVPIGVPASWPERAKRSLNDVLHWERF